MTKPAGTYAKTLAAFVVAREVRARRQRAGLSPDEAAKRAGVGRGKLDALELGYYGTQDRRKRPARLRVSELRSLFSVIGIAGDDGDALESLADAAGALAAEPRPSPRSPTLAARIESLSDQHRGEYGTTNALAPIHERLDWTPPSPRCARFYGRRALVEELVAALRADGPNLLLVSGPAGIGKSELVQVALRHPDLRRAFAGLRWLSARRREFVAGARGPDRSTVRDTDVLRDLARSLRCGEDELPRALAAAQWLIVIDNLEAVDDEAELVSQIARMSGQSRFVFTSRSRLAAAFLRNVPEQGTLPGLGPVDIRDFIVDSIGHVPDALVRRTLEVTRGAPLLLHWLIGQGRGEPLEVRLEQLASGEVDDLYRYTFEQDWRRATTKARDILDFLAHQTAEPVPAAVIAGAGVAPDETSRALNELVESGLVETNRDGGTDLISLHPLTSAFVRRRLGDATRWSGNRQTAWAAGLAYLQGSLSHDRAGTSATRPIGGIANYLDWMADAVVASEPAQALISWLKLSRYLWEHWQWQHFARCEEIAAEASDALSADHANAGAMLAGLSRTDAAYQQLERGEFDGALELIADALRRFDALDDDAGRSLCYRYRGLVHLRRKQEGDLAQARAYLAAALAVIARGRERGFPAPGTPAAIACDELRSLQVWDTLIAGYAAYRADWAPSEAEIHTLLAGVLFDEGRHVEAVAAAREAIARYRESAYRWPGSEAAPMLTLGRALVATTQLAQARATFEDALGVAQATSRLDLTEGALLELARLDASSDRRRARERAEAALAIATSLHQPAEIAGAEALLETLRRDDVES